MKSLESTAGCSLHQTGLRFLIFLRPLCVRLNSVCHRFTGKDGFDFSVTLSASYVDMPVGGDK